MHDRQKHGPLLCFLLFLYIIYSARLYIYRQGVSVNAGQKFPEERKIDAASVTAIESDLMMCIAISII